MSGKKPINVEIKRINRSSIYRHFFQNTALTKQNLVSDLQLCLPTVTKNIDALVADGLIEKSGSQEHTGGRRATTYSIVRDARIALGIDVTNNHVTVVATDLTDGNLSAFFEGLKAGEGAFKKAWDVYLDYLDNVKERAARLNTFSNDADYLKTCSYKKESIAAGAALTLSKLLLNPSELPQENALYIQSKKDRHKISWLLSLSRYFVSILLITLL